MTGKHTGIAVASACTTCAWLISSPPEYAPGRHMAIVHDHHVPELQALGWVLTEYPHEPPDVVCRTTTRRTGRTDDTAASGYRTCDRVAAALSA
jgi:hypothetical protein